ETRIINWDPSWDPDGDPVLYFVRIGSTPGEENIMAWRTTYKDRFVELPSWLGPGTYWVQLMASDGMSFSRVATYRLIIGIFRVKVTSVDHITLKTTDNDSIELNITNLGTASDDFVIKISGSALYTEGITISPTGGKVNIYTGGSKIVPFNISTHSAKPGTYYLNFTIVSPKTSASARQSVLIEVIGKGGGTPSGLQPTPAEPTLKWYHIGIILFFAALGVLIVREIYLIFRSRKRAE
ncbi:MAG: hypothetical protein J7L88_05035, partial [Thermoplasmata archaeon]|nr:hypothetical protein [Thermoplasmata archaeon]